MASSGIPEWIKGETLLKLITVGRREETFDLLGNSITIETLDDGEIEEASREGSGLDVVAKISNLKVATLCRAITKVNDRPFPEDKQKRLDEARQFVRLLPGEVVQYIWGRYNTLAKMTDEIIRVAIENEARQLKN